MSGIPSALWQESRRLGCSSDMTWLLADHSMAQGCGHGYEDAGGGGWAPSRLLSPITLLLLLLYGGQFFLYVGELGPVLRFVFPASLHDFVDLLRAFLGTGHPVTYVSRNTVSLSPGMHSPCLKGLKCCLKWQHFLSSESIFQSGMNYSSCQGHCGYSCLFVIDTSK